jgi:hypothetical protein
MSLVRTFLRGSLSFAPNGLPAPTRFPPGISPQPSHRNGHGTDTIRQHHTKPASNQAFVAGEQVMSSQSNILQSTNQNKRYQP